MAVIREIVFKYRPCEPRSFDILTNKELWFSDPDSFNDPFDCRMDYKEALHKIVEQNKRPNNVDPNIIMEWLDSKINKARICCFSKTKKNQLMWSHYANEHKGFCIGFNIRSLLENGNNLTTGALPVNYKSNNPYEDILKDYKKFYRLGGDLKRVEISESFLRKALSTKYTGWKYEKEVRMISTKIETLKFKAGSVNSITFGLRMTAKDKQHLRKLLSGEEWTHVKWFETVKATNRYALNFNLL